MVAKKSVVFKNAMDAEDKEIAEVCEAHINELIDRGDPDREIAQFVNRTVTDDTYNAPDELLDAMFTRGKRVSLVLPFLMLLTVQQNGLV